MSAKTSTPFWRWMRAVAYQESMALRAYARNGMPAPPYVPVDLLADYHPARKLANMIPCPPPNRTRTGTPER